MLLRHRHQWVRLRSRVQHTPQSMALNRGLRLGHSLWSRVGQQAFRALPLAPHASKRRATLLVLYPHLQGSIDELDKEVCEEVSQHPPARRLLTHPGVVPITALATEVFLGESAAVHRRKSAGQLYRDDPERTLQRTPPSAGYDEQTTERATALSVV